jgi:hypothetical protein
MPSPWQDELNLKGPEGKRLLEEIEARDRRRSQRVMLQMPVHVRLQTADGRLLRQDGFTQVVNAHGGLLEMESKPEPGQRMLLMNPNSGVEQSATVVLAKKSRDGGYAVAFEFDSPTPRLWAVVFPPDDWKVEPS